MWCSRKPRLRHIVALAVLAWGLPSRPEDPRTLNVSWALDGSITGAALAVWGVSELAKDSLTPRACRWCSTDGLDGNVRNAVVWSNTRAAATASDILEFGIPVGVAAYDLFAASDAASAASDVLVVAEAVAITGVVTQDAKYTVARIRPYAFYSGRDSGPDDHLSFWSGHTVTAFSAAAAGGTVARMRHFQGWPWVYAAGFTGAALTGYFRMASDKHWPTDVLASAAAGTGIGILVPWFHRAGLGAASYRVLPAPGGLVFAGKF